MNSFSSTGGRMAIRNKSERKRRFILKLDFLGKKKKSTLFYKDITIDFSLKISIQ